MPQTIEGIKGKDLFKALQASVEPDRVYYVTLYTEDERLKNIEILENIADKISEEAEKKGVTPKDLDDFFGKDISHIL